MSMEELFDGVRGGVFATIIRFGCYPFVKGDLPVDGEISRPYQKEGIFRRRGFSGWRDCDHH